MKTIILSVLLSLTSGSLWAGTFFTIEDGVITMVPKEKTHVIKDFSTDGCSSFPDGFFPTQSTEWLDCCIVHDIDYWIGGEEHLKEAADEELGACVAERANPALGWAMDLGVTIGGKPSLMPWRWGYGWESIIGYAPIDKTQFTSAASKYETVIKAINKEADKMDFFQRYYILTKLESKLLELYPYLGADKKDRDNEYSRLAMEARRILYPDL